VPAALQCPDCGHQEMLDNVGDVSTFRCGGCGRALKVPAQFRRDPKARRAAPGARPPGPGDATQAMPRVPSGAVPPVVGAGVPPVRPSPTPSMAPPLVGAGVTAAMPTTRSPVAIDDDGTGAGSPPLDPPGPPPMPSEGPLPPSVPPAPGSLRPPLVLRLALWVIALPLGSLIAFGLASSFGLLTKVQLENTFVLTGWGRFVPIARLLPFCALAIALLVQLGEIGLEWRRARTLRKRSAGRRGQGPGGGGARPRPRPGPLTPNGQGQRPTNGARSRDRAIS
jgi:hypothetical protein